MLSRRPDACRSCAMRSHACDKRPPARGSGALLTGDRYVARAVAAAQDLMRQAGHADPGGKELPTEVVSIRIGSWRSGSVAARVAKTLEADENRNPT